MLFFKHFSWEKKGKQKWQFLGIEPEPCGRFDKGLKIKKNRNRKILEALEENKKTQKKTENNFVIKFYNEL